jgi:copper chaperone CopZ
MGITLKVAGMTCDHCARSVAEALRAIDGVASLEVDLGSGLVSLRTDAPVPMDALVAAVVEAGYEVAA